MGPASPTTLFDADDSGGVNEFVSESEWQPTQLQGPALAVSGSGLLDTPEEHVAPHESSQIDTSSPELALSHVISLASPLSWQEAVALVREYLQSAHERSLADPSESSLTAAGDVRPRAEAAPVDHPARAAAELLMQLLPPDAPPSLSGLAAQESGPAPRRRSPQDLSQALAFFERPNRRADLAALWARADTAAARWRAEHELARLRRRIEQPFDVPPIVSHKRQWWQSWTWQDIWAQNYALGAVLCGIMAVGSSAWLFVTLTGGGTLPPPLAARPLPRIVVSLPALPLRAKALPSWQQSTSDEPTDVGPARLRVADALPAPAPTPVPTTGVADAGESADAWIVTMRELVPEPTRPENITPPRATARGRTAAPARIYSLADAEVTPAALKWPRTSLEVVSVEQAGASSVIRLIVDEVGRVERVRLISPGGSINDRMILAAAKAWVFRPARLLDRPVKYQLDVRVP